MNIVVLVKQVSDINAVKIDRSSGTAVLSGQMVINSFDEYAIEEAIRLKEKHGGDVTVVCAGPASAKDAVTRALAMGADKGVHLLTGDTQVVDSLSMANALASAVKELPYDVILMGQSSDDSATGHVGPQLAEVLELPSVSAITALSVDGTHVTATRDTEDGKETVEFDLPAVLMAITGLNEPRYPSLKGIMAAKKKPISQSALSIAPSPNRVTWSDPTVPERSVEGTILQDVPSSDAAKQLVSWLKDRKLL